MNNVVRWLGCLGLALQILMAPAARAAGSGPIESPWTALDNARVRAVAGRATGPDGKENLYAGVQVELADGWKTYWRNPGTSGVPPQLDTAGSKNLATATLLFPAPTRFSERDGDTVGYKHAVMFPVAIQPKDTTTPVELRLAITFGICKDICIPAEATLSLAVPGNVSGVAERRDLAAAVERVPRLLSALREMDPRVSGVKAQWQGSNPHIVIDALFPGGGRGADLFAEAPPGLWVPLPRRMDDETSGDRVRFRIDLGDGVDAGELKGRALRLTLVGGRGQSEAEVVPK